MVGDVADAEAERIVSRLAVSYTHCMAQNVVAQQVGHFPEAWRKSSEAERDELHRQLVVLVAAAVRWVEVSGRDDVGVEEIIRVGDELVNAVRVVLGDRE